MIGSVIYQHATFYCLVVYQVLVTICFQTTTGHLDLTASDAFKAPIDILKVPHRCSHVPPKPENITHVWFESADYQQRYRRHKRQHRDNASRIDDPDLDVSHEDTDRVPLKIKIFYDRSVDRLDVQKYALIKNNVMPTVVDFFRGVLTIKREDALKRYRIRRRCPQNVVIYMPTDGNSKPFCFDRCEDYATCGEVVVPSNHLAACSYCDAVGCRTDFTSEGDGVWGSQFLLYVSAEQTVRCRRDQTIAYAAHCAQDLRSDRPIAGHANLCPDSISTDPKDLSALISTVKHELTHVLGFSVSLFAYYRDEAGRPLTERDLNTGRITIDPNTGYPRWSNRTIKKITRKDWITAGGPVNKTVHLVVTPTVKRAVREHFNCSELDGAELEDQGSDGTSMTHWEKRVFENEAMTGTHTQNSIYSRITLAMLQDTGWYKANFSRAEELEWGRSLGCDFAQQSCKSWIDKRRAQNVSIRPFCDRPKGEILQISCTDDRNSKAVCNMKQYDEALDPIYRNFDYIDGVEKHEVSHYGGSVDLADYCPFMQEFTWQARNVTVRGSRCEFEGNNLDRERNAALEQYGNQTKCFEHARRWEQRSCNFRRHWHHYGAGCYRYICQDGHLSIVVQNESFACYEPGQIVRVELVADSWLHSGTIVCPACDKVCPSDQCYWNSSVKPNLIETEDTSNFTSSNLSDPLHRPVAVKHKLICSAANEPPTTWSCLLIIGLIVSYWSVNYQL